MSDDDSTSAEVHFGTLYSWRGGRGIECVILVELYVGPIVVYAEHICTGRQGVFGQVTAAGEKQAD